MRAIATTASFNEKGELKIDKLGGNLKVESKEGDGSKFLIYLPFLNNQI